MKFIMQVTKNSGCVQISPAYENFEKLYVIQDCVQISKPY